MAKVEGYIQQNNETLGYDTLGIIPLSFIPRWLWPGKPVLKKGQMFYDPGVIILLILLPLSHITVIGIGLEGIGDNHWFCIIRIPSYSLKRVLSPCCGGTSTSECYIFSCIYLDCDGCRGRNCHYASKYIHGVVSGFCA